MNPSKKFTKTQANEFVAEIDKLPDAAFNDLIAQWENHVVTDYSEEYEELRKKIIAVFEEAKRNGKGYEIDLRVGLAIYREFNPATGFSLVMANDDDIWRYLSCKVFPDITYERYPKPEKEVRENGGRLNHKRFYSHTRRIWLKTLWWYVFLSWQGDEKSTYEVLKHFGTDTISDFIERTGRGYRVLMYRQLMLAYSQADNKLADTFNRLQVQNLVNCRTTEPALVKGAEKGYVDKLFEQLSISRSNVD